jgi:hypothetical protein
MSPSAGRFLTRDPIGFKGGMLLYGNYWWLRSADPYGLQSLNADGGKGSPPPKTRDQNCAACCCCLVGITATSAQPDDLPTLTWYWMQGIDITFTIMPDYQPAPAGAKDVNCKLAFQEFVDPSTTDRLSSAAGYKQKVWTDQVASRPESPFFTPWDDFNRNESKSCTIRHKTRRLLLYCFRKSLGKYRITFSLLPAFLKIERTMFLSEN